MFVYFATHPDMWAYLPSNITRYQTPKDNSTEDTKQSQSGAMAFYNTNELKHKFYKYAVACSLTNDCIFPNYPLLSTMNKVTVNGVSIYFNHDCVHLREDRTQQDPYQCHRDDQSLFDILCKNFYDFQWRKYDGWKFQLEMRQKGIDSENKTLEDEYKIVCHDGWVLARTKKIFGPNFRKCNVGGRAG